MRGRSGVAAALVGLAVLVVVAKVVFVGLVEVWPVADDEEVFGVGFFGAGGEVEAAGDDRLAIDQHDFVVGDGVSRVDERGDAGVGDEVGAGVLFRFLAFVEDDIDGDSAVVGLDKRVGDRHG